MATIFGYLIANTFIITAGYLTTLTTEIESLPSAMIQLGLGFGGLLVLILAQWTTNDNNLYTSSLSLSNIFRIKKSNLVLIIGAISGGMGVVDYFTDWLNFLGIGVPPMAGIIIADYYVIKKQKYDIDQSILPKWNYNAVISWVLAGIIGFTVSLGIASLNSLLAAFIIYIVLEKINPIKLKESI